MHHQHRHRHGREHGACDARPSPIRAPARSRSSPSPAGRQTGRPPATAAARPPRQSVPPAGAAWRSRPWRRKLAQHVGQVRLVGPAQGVQRGAACGGCVGGRRVRRDGHRRFQAARWTCSARCSSGRGCRQCTRRFAAFLPGHQHHLAQGVARPDVRQNRAGLPLHNTTDSTKSRRQVRVVRLVRLALAQHQQGRLYSAARVKARVGSSCASSQWMRSRPPAALSNNARARVRRSWSYSASKGAISGAGGNGQGGGVLQQRGHHREQRCHGRGVLVGQLQSNLQACGASVTGVQVQQDRSDRAHDGVRSKASTGEATLRAQRGPGLDAHQRPGCSCNRPSQRMADPTIGRTWWTTNTQAAA